MAHYPVNHTMALNLFYLIAAVMVHYGDCARILCFFPAPSVSHQNIFQPIWRQLALKGHDLTVITPFPLNDTSLKKNLREIDVGFTRQLMRDRKLIESISSKNFVFGSIWNLFTIIQEIVEWDLTYPEVEKLINSSEDSGYYDVLLVQGNHIYPLVYGLGARFRAPVVAISSMDFYLHIHDAAGNPTHPLVSPDIMLNFHGQLGFFEKVWSFLYNILYRMLYYWYALPTADKVARKHFGDDIPYLGDIEKNISLFLSTINPIIHPVRPNVPNMIEINQIHIKAKKPLPKDLQDYLDSAPQGVVYFSLGSNVRSVDMTEETRKVIIQALAELPYKVLWKWETDNLPGCPDNVLTRKWLPQADVLGHPNVKVFITQGGLQSIEEAISNEVPMVGIPYITDQPYNVRKLEDFGIAIGLDHKTITKDQLKNAILQVAEDEKFRERAKVAKAILTDQPIKGVEKAVWWIEYVIRHKGARHLRSPAADMSFFEYFLVDVIAFLVFCFVLVGYIVAKLLSLFTNKAGPTKKKRKSD